MKKRKFNPQVLFCFVSFIFLATCCFWYGGRFIYFYLENEKEFNKETTNKKENNKLVQSVIDNSDLKNINNSYYFSGNVSNNYLKYSNLIWRIIKIDDENTVYLISDNIVTSLANTKENYIFKWLNSSEGLNTGLFQKNLNNPSDYLVNYKVCDDKVNNLNNLTCNKNNDTKLIGLLSIVDYINTGGEKSFINNGKYIYLNNINDENNLWYLNNEGKLGTTTNDDIYGIKPVIRLNSSVEVLSGNGTLNNPYVIEKESSLFGSYVKLGNDIWRIYDVNGENVKLMLDDYLMVNNEKLFTNYSDNNYYHNDTVYSSLAYYLNHEYLNSLSYKNVINISKWSNYYYSNETNYNYQEVIKNNIDTKVSLISVGDIILNNNNENFFTNTGTDNTSNMVYIIDNDGTLDKKSVKNNGYVIPCISINKNILTKGKGTLDVPYEME